MFDRSILDNAYKKDLNQIKINTNNTFNHEMVKSAVSYILKKNGHDFYTEAIFRNGKRADVIDTEEQCIIEVLESESLSNIINKQKSYPLKIYPVKIDAFTKVNLTELKSLIYNKLWFKWSIVYQ